MPTLCDYANISIPHQLEGNSIRKFIKKPETCNPDQYTVLETEFAQRSNSYGIKGRAHISGSWKYIIYSQGKNREQLFNLEKDPSEMNDLTLEESFNTEITKMRARLKIWCTKHKDDFLIFIPE